MRVLGWILIVFGIVWIPMCFMSTAMMSRGVDWYFEAVLPSALGLLLVLFGIWLLNRKRPPPPERSA